MLVLLFISFRSNTYLLHSRCKEHCIPCIRRRQALTGMRTRCHSLGGLLVTILK